jgi:glycine cleavage system H protein
LSNINISDDHYFWPGYFFTSHHYKENKMVKFSEDHEWVKLDGDIAEVGISPHAVEQLGDIVFIELPDIGTNVTKGDAVAVFESVKAASDIYSPAGGEIIDVNTALADDLGAITADDAMNNWLFKVKLTAPSDLDGLMDEDQYNAMID